MTPGTVSSAAQGVKEEAWRRRWRTSCARRAGVRTGVVTWATLKLELLPTKQKLIHLQSENLAELMELQYQLLKYRLCDELFIVDRTNLACLLEKNPETIVSLAESYAQWNLIIVLSGHGKLQDEKISYLEADIHDILEELDLLKLTQVTALNDHEILDALRSSAADPWRLRYKGACHEIFFITNYERIPEFITEVKSKWSGEIGVYIQPLNQGTSYHLEFDLYYDPASSEDLSAITQQFLDISAELIAKGAFFNRPYRAWKEQVYNHNDSQTQTALKKVKKIFDPNNVLNPGVLCFDDSYR